MQSLSVLIPTYHCSCLPLVEQLHKQLEQTAIPYEIIVGDDGSTDTATIQANQPINDLPHCQYIVRTENTGRAAIRNFLAQTAQYEFLLFIDSDMTIVSETFIQHYLAADCQTVVDGGITVCGDPVELKGNLRYLYEQAEAPHHTATERQHSPHQHIHTANLLIRRDLMLQYPFDERFRHYGYEDVLLGKTLQRHHIPMLHIDNPLGAIVLLSQAPWNRIERLIKLQAYAAIVPSISGKRWDQRIAEGLHETENWLAGHTAVYHLECLPNEAAAQLCRETVATHP